MKAEIKCAATCLDCDGCQWQQERDSDNWCYMFTHRPAMLPCTQHNKFKETRDMIAGFIRKRPAILSMIVMGHLNETTTTPNQ